MVRKPRNLNPSIEKWMRTLGWALQILRERKGFSVKAVAELVTRRFEVEIPPHAIQHAELTGEMPAVYVVLVPYAMGESPAALLAVVDQVLSGGSDIEAFRTIILQLEHAIPAHLRVQRKSGGSSEVMKEVETTLAYRLDAHTRTRLQ